MGLFISRTIHLILEACFISHQNHGCIQTIKHMVFLFLSITEHAHDGVGCLYLQRATVDVCLSPMVHWYFIGIVKGVVLYTTQ